MIRDAIVQRVQNQPGISQALRGVVIGAVLGLMPMATQACMITATKCVSAGEGFGGSGSIVFHKPPQRPPPVEIGDRLPDTYTMLMNRSRYGLPPVGEGWHYYRVESRVYRVEFGTRTVLEDVTHLVNRAFY